MDNAGCGHVQVQCFRRAHPDACGNLDLLHWSRSSALSRKLSRFRRLSRASSRFATLQQGLLFDSTTRSPSPWISVHSGSGATFSTSFSILDAQQMRAVSDYDTPIRRTLFVTISGRRGAASAQMNKIVDASSRMELTGTFRDTRVPFTISDGSRWATNWKFRAARPVRLAAGNNIQQAWCRPTPA